MNFKNIYVAATSQHVGKTTSTLGIAALLMKRGYKIGYCKPVGQKFLDLKNLRVDKDAVLFADLIDFSLDPAIHSPVIFGKGSTEEYLDDPSAYNYPSRILGAAKTLESQNEFVIYEGTGHPGVGSIANLSNADVAKMLNAGVIMIVEGGIGSTIDKLNMCLALFRESNVPIIGVIINKVKPDKMDRVSKYVGLKLKMMGLPLLGVVPFEKTLANPIMETITSVINGEVLYNKNQLDNPVEDIVAGSLIGLKELKTFRNLLLVVSTRMVDEAIHKINSIAKWVDANHSPLSGIVATGDGEISEQTKAYVQQFNIPYVHTRLDTYGSVIKISRIEVKINRNTPWKVNRAIELIEENVDLDLILNQIK